MSNWITPSSIKQPQRSDFSSTGDFDLAYDVWAAIQNASYNFVTSGNYGTPEEYLASMVQYAFSETQNNYLLKRVPADWPWALNGVKAAMQCFGYLKQIPVRLGDDNAASVYAAWVDPSLRVPGAVAPPVPDTGDHSATGQSAAPAGSIL